MWREDTVMQKGWKVYVTLFAVGASLASQAQDIVNLRPIRQQTNVVGQRWSSTQIQPQIQEVIHPGRVVPPHQNPLIYPAAVTNNLPLGGLSNTPRGTLKRLFPGISATGWTPPDPNLAVGPNHIVEVVNSDIAFFTKANGTKTFQVAMGPVAGAAEGFFESLGVSSFVFDPKCTYDPVAGRFFVVALELNDATQESKLLLAVSDDNDPNGTWFKYRIEAKLDIGGNITWMDYPSIAVNKDAFVCSGNQFGFASGFGGVQLLVVKKGPLLNGAPTTTSSILVQNGFTLQPARSVDPTADKIYCVSTGSTTSTLQVYALTSLTTTPVLNSRTITVPAYSYPFDIPQSTNGRFLDNIGDRMMEADYRAGKLYASHTVAVSNNDNRNAARWYEINTNNFPQSDPSISQAGNVTGGVGEHCFQPAISVNSAGDVALIFSRSSSAITADVMVTGRRLGDPSGTMGPPILIQSSLGTSYGNPGGNRWGDYFALEVDPVDNLTFWGVCMVANTNGSWLTTIHSATISDVLPGQSTESLEALLSDVYVDPNSNPNIQGTNYTGDLSNLSISDDQVVSIDSVMIDRLGQVASAEMTFNTSGNPALLKYLGARVEALAPTGTTGMIWMYDFVSSKYVQIKSWKMKQTGNTNVDAVISRNRNRYVSSTGDIKVVVRVLKPIRTGRGASQLPTPFTATIDLATARVRF